LGTIKTILINITPPIIINIIKRTIRRPRLLESEDHIKYRNYYEALTDCTQDAYEDIELVNVILEKTKRFKNGLDNNIISISEVDSYSLVSLINPIIDNFDTKTINVIDFGGACGAHYFHSRALLDKRIKLNWYVVEKLKMVEFAKVLETDELKFTNDLNAARSKLGNIDLLHTSGALQCVDEPLKYLKNIIDLDAKWILFSRLGVNQIDREVITVHTSKLSWNGRGELPNGFIDKEVKYPFTFFSEKKFLIAIQEKYKILYKFNDNTGIVSVVNENIIGYGLLCKKK
jgi:putative methyltransferase (TIGR04325 family)